MHSFITKTRFHYPQVKFRDGKKWLWNPILKKAFVNRPEERVRLQLVEYFVETAAVSPHKISFESPVKTAVDKTKSRTDLLIYDENYKPLLLAECKSRDIMLDEKTAKQAARYHQVLKTPYMLISNGIFDYWFDMKTMAKEDNNRLKPLKEIPEIFKEKKQQIYNFRYWRERAFAGADTRQSMRSYVSQSCRQLFSDESLHVIYLNYESYPPEYALPGYYAISSFEDGCRLAVAIHATPYGDSRLNVILNKSGENLSFVSVSLNLLAEEQKQYAELHSGAGIQYPDLEEEFGFSVDREIMDFKPAFKEFLLQNS